MPTSTQMIEQNTQNHKKWSKEEFEFLERHFATMPLQTISRKLKRGIEGIKSAANKRGIHRPKRKGVLFNENGKRRYRILSNNGGCWQWTAAVNKKGYPIARGPDTTLAHRQIYIDAHGPIPAELEVDHTCRNRRCVNLEHLEAVTHQENVRRGSRTKLNRAKAEKIKAAPSTVTSKQLAKRYGVSVDHIRSIKNGRSWL